MSPMKSLFGLPEARMHFRLSGESNSSDTAGHCTHTLSHTLFLTTPQPRARNCAGKVLRHRAIPEGPHQDVGPRCWELEVCNDPIRMLLRWVNTFWCSFLLSFLPCFTLFYCAVSPYTYLRVYMGVYVMCVYL